MSHTNPLPSLPDVQAFQNTDREVWRETPGDFYSNSVHLTATGGLGINVGGTVYVKPPAEWHRLASGARSTAAQPLPESAEWEMREDGKLVRKDRWQTGMRRIVALLWGNRHEFEVDEVVEAVRALCPAPYNDGDDEGLVRAILAAAPPAAAQPVEPTVTPTEAVVGFASWVTCRPGTLPAGEGHDAAPWSEAVHEFVVAQGWPTVRDVFPHNLKRPPLSAPPAASGDSTPPSAPVQGDPSGALRPEPEAAGQDCHGLDTPERVRFYEHDFYVLSNFSAFNLRWRGHTFPTSEHAYHHEKFEPRTRALGEGMYVRDAILDAPSAHEAFKVAERFTNLRRPNWDAVKVGIMREILRAKAQQHEYVRRKLLATGDRELVEDSWRDDFWGWGPNRDGKNMLGKLWMEVRAELRAASQQADREAE